MTSRRSGEMRQLVRQLKREGFTVVTGGGGHAEVRAPDGKRITTMSLTPSDFRWKQNTLAPVRRWQRQQKEMTCQAR